MSALRGPLHLPEPSRNGSQDVSIYEPLLSFLASARPYLTHLGRPLELSSAQWPHGAHVSLAQSREVLHAICAPFGLHQPIFTESANSKSDLESFVGSRLLELVSAATQRSSGGVDIARAEATRHAQVISNQLRSLTSHDGADLDVFVAGHPNDRAVVILGPCGLPATITRRWLSALAKHHYVLAIGTRGFSERDTGAWEHDLSLSAQARDVLATIDRYSVRRAHVMGICGGAVVALSAALLRPQNIASLGLWYGDFNVGDAACDTRYQIDLRWLMAEAARSAADASRLQYLLTDRRAVARAPRDLVHLVLYPYSTVELLHRYGRANGSIMQTNVLSYARDVTLPALVVTSDDDRTTHPMGSRRVAEALSRGVLIESPGDHLECVRANPSAERIALEFMADTL